MYSRLIARSSLRDSSQRVKWGYTMFLNDKPGDQPTPAGLRLVPGSSARRRSTDSGIVHARSQDGLLTWSFTTFLTHTHKHPEILVAGLDPFLSNSVLRHLTEMVAHHHVYSRRSSVVDLLPHLTCVFREMAPLAAARLIQGLGTSSALQLIYPDPHNQLPWQPGHNPTWRQVQPLFLANCAVGPLEQQYLDAALKRPLQADRRANSDFRAHLVTSR